MSVEFNCAIELIDCNWNWKFDWDWKFDCNWKFDWLIDWLIVIGIEIWHWLHIDWLINFDKFRWFRGVARIGEFWGSPTPPRTTNWVQLGGGTEQVILGWKCAPKPPKHRGGPVRGQNSSISVVNRSKCCRMALAKLIMPENTCFGPNFGLILVNFDPNSLWHEIHGSGV